MARTSYNWKEIQAYHDAGHGFIACREKFGCSHWLWMKAIRSGKLLPRYRVISGMFKGRRTLYDWRAVQQYYDEGHSYRECRRKFGFSPATWHKATLRGEITSRSQTMSIDDLLTGPRNRGHVKQRLMRVGLLHNVCSECGLREWRAKPITMHIDHINGVRHDHRLENLRMLCPNCHSQTPTYSGRNMKRSRSLQEDG